eukprot:11975582-Alexandrium_andersonii.AAC.1
MVDERLDLQSRPWCARTNEDLLGVIHGVLSQRGRHNTLVTKVLAHSGEEHVRAGQITRQQMWGNGKGD